MLCLLYKVHSISTDLKSITALFPLTEYALLISIEFMGDKLYGEIKSLNPISVTVIVSGLNPDISGFKPNSANNFDLHNYINIYLIHNYSLLR